MEHDNNFHPDISRLISRHIAGELTAAEREQLDRWLSDQANSKLFGEIISEETMREKIGCYRNENVQAAFESFALRRARMASRSRRLRWYAAAGIMIPLMVAGLFLLRQTPHEAAPRIALEQPTERRTPTLTLSTGEKVEIGGGFAAQEQGGTVISAATDGIMDYSSLKSAEDRGIYNRLEVPAMCDYHFILSDGTKVWMNAKSTLRYPVVFESQERVLEAWGEIYFEVKHDALRPFRVIANGVKVEVTGTAFNINSYPDEDYCQVTLAEGRVKVRVADGDYELQPGNQLNWERGTDSPQIRNVNVEDYISWKDGLYVFRSRRLGEVIKVVQRWYDVEIVFANPEAANLVYTGVVMKEDSLEDFMLRLEATSPYTFEQQGQRVVIR